jgi:hypothetical protein
MQFKLNGMVSDVILFLIKIDISPFSLLVSCGECNKILLPVVPIANDGRIIISSSISSICFIKSYSSCSNNLLCWTYPFSSPLWVFDRSNSGLTIKGAF